MIESSLQQNEMVPLPVQPFGRLVRSVAGYGVATALMLVSPLLVFAPAALFRCAARNGRRAAWWAALIAAGLAALYFAQVANASAEGAAPRVAWSSFLAVVLSIAIPAVAVLPLVGRGESFGKVLLFCIAAGAIGLGVTELVMRGAAGFSPYDAQLAQAREAGGGILQMYRNADAGSEVVRGIEQWMQYAMHVLPAWILVDICLVFVLSLMMFGRLKAWSGFTARPDPAAAEQRVYLFRSLAFPDWLLFAFVFGGLTPITSGILQKVAANVLAVALFLYLLQGLAIFRALLVRARVGVVGTMIGFLLLGLMSMAGLGLVLLIAAGLFDSFFDFRHLKRKDDSHESHTD